MFDTHTIARTLTDAGIDPKHADAITDAVRQAAEHSEHVTPEHLDAALAALEARLTWRFAGAILAQTIAMLGGMGRHPAVAWLIPAGPDGVVEVRWPRSTRLSP